jgi:hypothetical protein
VTRRRLERPLRLVIGVSVGAAVVAVLLVVLLTSGGSKPRSHGAGRQATIPSHRRCASAHCFPGALPRFFAADSIWNAPVANAPLDPRSSAIVGNLLAQEARESVGIATRSYGVPIYVAAANQPSVHVTLDQGPASGALQQAFDQVPIPPGAQAAQGTDANLAVYQPSTDTLWVFWKLSKRPEGWHAGWGGRVLHVSTDPGYYRNLTGPTGNVVEKAGWGTTAASFPVVAGVMTIPELQAGHIDHALALAITHTRAGVWAAPAQRTDGDLPNPDVVPEGAHFRLDPQLDLASLHLNRFVLMMAEAAQKYGIIINNRSSGFTFRGQDPLQYEQNYGYNPYVGRQHQPGSPGALYSQFPSQMLREFPWSHLQLLKMDLRSASGPVPGG